MVYDKKRATGQGRKKRTSLTPLGNKIWTSIVGLTESFQEICVWDAGFFGWPERVVAVAAEEGCVAEIDVLEAWIVAACFGTIGSGVGSVRVCSRICHLAEVT